MKPYDFSIDEYREFLNEQVPNRNKMPLLSKMHIHKGRKPKQAEQPLSDTDKEQDDPYPIYEEDEAAADDNVSPITVYNKDAQIDFRPKQKVSLQYDKEARLLGHFCNLVLQRLEDCQSKVEAHIPPFFKQGMISWFPSCHFPL
jgi:hypothetical protein